MNFSLLPIRALRARGHLWLLLAVLGFFPGSLFAVTLPVQTGLQLWLAGDTINPADPNQVTTVGTNKYVKDWVDLSPNHADAVQAVTTKQPAYVAGVQNGSSVVLFDGVDDLLATNLSQIAGNKSVFVVEKRINLPVPSGTEISTTSVASGFFFGNNGGAETVGRHAIAHDLQLPGLVNDYVLKSCIRSGSSLTLMVNDTTATTNVSDAASGKYTLSDSANGFPYSGAIAEILIYNRAVTELERQSIENYLSEKWALWTVPVPVRSNLQLWLSGDSLNFLDPSQTVVRSGTYYVTKWQGRSLPGRNAYQATAANQPKVILGGLNGRSVIRFDGKTSFLTTALPQIAGNKSIFLVESRATNAIGCEISTSAASGGMFLGSNNGWPVSFTGPFTEAKGRYGVGFDEQVPLLLNQFVIKSFIRNGTAETLLVNNAGSTQASVADAANGYYSISDNASFHFPGDLAEVLIYDRAVTPAESSSIQDYLQDKWSNTPNNVFATAPDITSVPAMTTGTPAAGVRVKQTSVEYAGTNVYHTLYLPKDWQPGRTYPVIVDYAGNGPFSDTFGDVNSGNVEDISLGYGITGGSGYIWVCMPTIGGSPLTNQISWWGDINATKDYCLKTVRHVCEDWGGDPSAVIISGFSRGAIACNYVGLGDDTIADVWLAFIPHAHYDGQFEWGQPNDDPASALVRLLRLKGRAQHVSHEVPITGTQAYLAGTGVDLSQFSFRTLPYSNHTDLWTLRPLQLRRDVRAWLQQILATRPGTHTVSGKVTQANGTPIAGARIQSGYTHFTFSAADGTYALGSLIDSARTVTVTANGFTFLDQAVTVSGANVLNFNINAN